MVYTNERGSLVTQGDQELRTIVTCLGRLKDNAEQYFPGEPEKAVGIKETCTKLSGKVAMLFFMTPLDVIDSEPRDVPVLEIAQRLGVDESVLDLPELGRVEHEFEVPEGNFIVMALLVTRKIPPIEELDQEYVVQADLMLQQLGH